MLMIITSRGGHVTTHMHVILVSVKLELCKIRF